ncbi:MAG: discoidin domain-containing protein, partial [Armatimonadota bacterium]
MSIHRMALLALSTAAVAAGVAQDAAGPAQVGPNVARGRPYTFGRPPNYGYCTDDGDSVQLTDGVYTEGYFWTQQTTVGWSNVSPVEITIDLGQDFPIRGCSYSTAAGVAGVAWPSSILLLVSDDAQKWYLAGDLIVRAAKSGVPKPDVYDTHRFVADDLETHGRYFRLLISPSGAYTFCDEIEVYEGPPALQTADRGNPIEDTERFYLQRRLASGVQTRLAADLSALRKAIAEANLPTDARAELNAVVRELEAQIRAQPEPFAHDYRAIHPLTPVHARIFATMGRLRRAQGLPGFFAWRKCRWDPLLPTEVPQKPGPPPSLEVQMMNNEYRAEAFNLSNLTDRDLTVRVRITGLPGGDDPDYVTVHQVEFVESQMHIPVADALPVAGRDSQGWRIVIPAGMTRQVWLTFNPVGAPPGVFRGNVVVAPGAGLERIRLPLTLHIYPLRFPDQPTCSLGVWDYTAFPYSYDITAENVLDAIENMRDHFVDTPWASSAVVPWPPKGAFDDEGNLVGELDFERFDSWIAAWPGSRNYAMFPSGGGSLAGVATDDPRFGKAVASWLKPWVEHMASLDLEPSQLYLLLVDEPHSRQQDARILAWAKAIKAAVP